MFSHKNLKTLYSKMNAELSKINEWFKANKLPLNITKTKYILFLKPGKVDDIPLQLSINSINIKRISMKFLGVILDQLTLTSHCPTKHTFSLVYYYIFSLVYI